MELNIMPADVGSIDDVVSASSFSTDRSSSPGLYYDSEALRTAIYEFNERHNGLARECLSGLGAYGVISYLRMVSFLTSLPDPVNAVKMDNIRDMMISRSLDCDRDEWDKFCGYVMDNHHNLKKVNNYFGRLFDEHRKFDHLSSRAERPEERKEYCALFEVDVNARSLGYGHLIDRLVDLEADEVIDYSFVRMIHDSLYRKIPHAKKVTQKSYGDEFVSFADAAIYLLDEIDKGACLDECKTVWKTYSSFRLYNVDVSVQAVYDSYQIAKRCDLTYIFDQVAELADPMCPDDLLGSVILTDTSAGLSPS